MNDAAVDGLSARIGAVRSDWTLAQVAFQHSGIRSLEFT